MGTEGAARHHLPPDVSSPYPSATGPNCHATSLATKSHAKWIRNFFPWLFWERGTPAPAVQMPSHHPYLPLTPVPPQSQVTEPKVTLLATQNEALGSSGELLRE